MPVKPTLRAPGVGGSGRARLAWPEGRAALQVPAGAAAAIGIPGAGLPKVSSRKAKIEVWSMTKVWKRLVRGVADASKVRLLRFRLH